MELPTRQVDMLANWRVSEVDLRLAELHIYGNSAGGRIGMYMLPRYDEDSDPRNDHLDNRVTTELGPDLANGDIYVRQLTHKRYEMKDHLGNVRVVISDLKVAPSGGRGPWAADILSWNNYYPFGMAQPDRHGNTEKYRYGFNGKEMDNEVKENPTTGTSGVGNHYDYGARGYDPRSGRWWSVDPLFKKYPSISSYTYVANNPIIYVDPDGREIVVPNKDDRAAVLKIINSRARGTFAFDDNGKLYVVKKEGSEKYSEYYRDKLIEGIESDKTITINIAGKFTYGGKDYDTDADWGGGATAGGVGTDQIIWISGNENKNLKDTKGKSLRDEAADILAHELVGHAIPGVAGSDTGNAVENENKVRKEYKEKNQVGESPLRAAEPAHKE